jgi:hypothetical protein
MRPARIRGFFQIGGGLQNSDNDSINGRMSHQELSDKEAEDQQKSENELWQLDIDLNDRDFEDANVDSMANSISRMPTASSATANITSTVDGGAEMAITANYGINALRPEPMRRQPSSFGAGYTQRPSLDLQPDSQGVEESDELEDLYDMMSDEMAPAMHIQPPPLLALRRQNAMRPEHVVHENI